MASKDVFIQKTDLKEYNNSTIFNPAREFEEAIDLDVKSDGAVYNGVRNLLLNMGLDKKNQGTKKWNPFSEFIKAGDKVVIKPNLVLHENKSGDSEDCMITNVAVIRPIIDYSLKALNGTGELIVGDAPVQDCDFKKVIELFGLKKMIEKYNEAGYKIKLMDFRKNQNSDLKCSIVNVGKYSSLCQVDGYEKKYAITNYDLREMHKHHNADKHEYMIPDDILSADVIINVPKPKTHRKAGMTACLKNFVGANSKKEFLPHHRNGSIRTGGDEYPERSALKTAESFLKNYAYTKNPIIDILRKPLRLEMKVMKKNRFVEGSWYGNDTIWRTVLDINKIMLYADKDGVLRDKKQRIVFNIADMIVAGEKEGPMMPSRKPTGLLVSGFNQLNVDKTICQIMGFDPQKIKYIPGGYALEKYKISDSEDFKVYDQDGAVRNIEEYNWHFIPTDGWVDYLLER